MYRKTIRYWWYSPQKLILLYLCPLYLFFCTYPLDDLQEKGMYDGHYYIDSYILFLGLYFLLLMAGSSYLIISSKNFIDSFKKREAYYIDAKFLEFIFLISVLSYLIWFRWLFSNPLILLQVIYGSANFIKHNYDTIPGVTTLSQLGVLYVIIYYWDIRKGRIFTTRFKAYFLISIFLAIARTILWSERLAFVEVVVPIGLIFIVTKRIKSQLIRTVINFGPLLAIGGLFIVFGLFEYVRSWGRYQYSYNSYIVFIVDRISLYYFTAINNVAAIIQETNWPSYSFGSILTWIYKFPGIGTFFAQIKPEEAFGNWGNFLSNYLDPEFNNRSGVLIAFTDSGLLGATLFAIAIGALTGVAYLSFVYNRGISRYLFPILFINLLDILRISYISDVRVFPIILFLFFAYVFFKKSMSSYDVLIQRFSS
ncbi:MAG: oligosaccharide repeat unit polymerase [Cyclobacteriaceae bacterium]